MKLGQSDSTDLWAVIDTDGKVRATSLFKAWFKFRYPACRIARVRKTLTIEEITHPNDNEPPMFGGAT